MATEEYIRCSEEVEERAQAGQDNAFGTARSSRDSGNSVRFLRDDVAFAVAAAKLRAPRIY